jgi:hypothetical protein
MSERFGQGICDDILDEFQRARTRFAPFNSAHEGYAVILEEVEELWTEIKDNKRIEANRQKDMRAEAIQIGAMIIAFITECCDNNSITGGM